MKQRRLKNGQAVAVHDNRGLRKRCACPRRKWPSCPHGWHLNIAWKGEHHRLALDKVCAPRVIRDKADALTEADRIRGAIRSGTFQVDAVTPAIPTTPDAITFGAFTVKWHERARADLDSAANDKAYISRLAKIELTPGERLGDRVLGSLTTDDFEAAFRTLAGLAASTRNKYRQCLKHLERYAHKKGYLPHSHVWLTADCAIKRQRHASRSRRLVPDVVDLKTGQVTEPGEERRLVATANPWLQRLIIAALETGCRRGELLSLQ